MKMYYWKLTAGGARDLFKPTGGFFCSSFKGGQVFVTHTLDRIVLKGFRFKHKEDLFKFFSETRSKKCPRDYRRVSEIWVKSSKK